MQLLLKIPCEMANNADSDKTAPDQGLHCFPCQFLGNFEVQNFKASLLNTIRFGLEFIG